MAKVLREAIHSKFPASVTVIAEPGRYYARSAYTLVSRVIARRRQMGKAAMAGTPDMLYQNDGVYGNFMNVIMEKEVMKPQLCGVKNARSRVSPKSNDGNTQKNSIEHRYSIWGPTCDSIDCVVREVTLESEVKVGDWLKYTNMGGEFLNHSFSLLG